MLGALGCVVPELLDGTNHLPWFKVRRHSSVHSKQRFSATCQVAAALLASNHLPAGSHQQSIVPALVFKELRRPMPPPPFFCQAGAEIFGDSGIQYLGIPGLINAKSIVATLIVQVC